MQLTEGQRLKKILEKLNLGQTDFAEKIESKKANISHWQRKDALPSGEQLRLIMKAFPQINLRYWFFEEGTELLDEHGNQPKDELQEKLTRVTYLLGQATAEKNEEEEKRKEEKEKFDAVINGLYALIQKFTGELPADEQEVLNKELEEQIGAILKELEGEG